MASRRVVITGLGVVSNIGTGHRVFSAALRAGVSGVSRFRAWNVLGFPCEYGGEVHDFRPARWLRRSDPARVGRCSQFAIAAARMAIEDSGIDPEVLARRGCGVSIGTTDGESQAVDHLGRQILDRGIEALEPERVLAATADELACSVAREFDLRGEAIVLSTACAAGNYAIGNAFDLIRSGELDFALGGGAESIARKSLAGFFRLGALSPDICRPFDRSRKGIIPGEGAGMMLLETLESAQARGACVYAEILGYGLSCDAKHATNPDGAVMAECMRRAHRNAGIAPEEVDWICAHGTGTPANDRVEAGAIREVFGHRPPPTSSIKSMIGHTMGAASAIGAVASAVAIRDGFIPPTINFETPDPECPIDCVPNQARPARLRVVQNDGFAFGGNNAVVILSAPEVA